MQELKFEELSARQKLGMTYIAFTNIVNRTPDEDAYILKLVRERSLGGVWITPGRDSSKELVQRILETADYPILIFTDAEKGIGSYTVGNHNAIACTGSEKQAYAFGKAVGVTARKLGYRVVCNPLLDMSRGSQRSLGEDKEKVSLLAAAIARGMHDGGVLTVGKHYPGASNPAKIDSHMAESFSPDTKEDLLRYPLYPYQRLMEEDLLDGIMVGHKKLPNIDPDYPASLSKKVIDIIRELGFDGFAVTDALNMMGIRAKFGDMESKSLAISAGIDFLLPFSGKPSEDFELYCDAYEKGMIPEESLDQAVKRVLAAQHKAMVLPKDGELTQEEIDLFRSINKDGVYAKCDEGRPTSISRDGKHYFAIMTRCDVTIENAGTVDVDTFSNVWHKPFEIKERLLQMFPNSKVAFINEFPTPSQNQKILAESLGCDEVVFLSFSEFLAFGGREQLTHRFVVLLEAMQMTNRVSTLIHFGNPFVLEELPHIPRYILGGISEDSVYACLDVLAGNYPAKGVPVYDFKLP